MKINFRFLSSIVTGIKSIFMRFPIAASIAVFIAIIGIFFVHNGEDESLTKILMTLLLGFPLFISDVLWTDQKKWNPSQKSLLHLGILGFLGIYHWLLPDSLLEGPGIFFFRFGMWMIGFILLITFIPFLNTAQKSIRTFWEYNKNLFTNFIQSAFFALVLFLGLAAAIWSIDTLFGLTIDGERYGELWVICASIVAPWLFLHDIPKTPEKQKDTEYEKPLIILTQYILIPLVILYFVILYTYTGKVLISQEWPKGIVASMIIGFSFVGVVTHMILYPRLMQISWIARFFQYFYMFLLPQTFILFTAVGMRINQYSWTESRYFVVLFGLWLLGMGIYFLINKTKDIRIISISLFFIVLLSSFGPWGAFSISQKAQFHRLTTLLEKNNMIENGKAKETKDKEAVSFEDQKEISATIRYLYQRHGKETLQPLLSKEIDSFITIENKDTIHEYKNTYAVPRNIVESLNLRYIEQWEIEQIEENLYFGLSHSEPSIENIDGYEYMISLNSYKDDTEVKKPFTIQEKPYTFILDIVSQKIQIKENEIIVGEFSLIEHLKKTIKETPNIQMKYSDTFPEDLRVFEAENERIKIKFLFDNISGERKNIDTGFLIQSMGGTLLLKFQ